MSTSKECLYCQGRCCRDDLGYRIEHMAAEFYEHYCEHCDDGEQRVVVPSFKDEIRQVLLEGSDDDLWPPGLTMVEVVERLRDFYLAKRHDEQRRDRREQRLRDLGFEELTEDQRAWNRLVNLGIGDKP